MPAATKPSKASRASSPAEISREWRDLLSLLPGYDPFRDPGGSWFEPEAALHALEFIEECCHHVEGDLAGKPFKLEPWQRSFIGNLFGWKRTDEYGRIVRRYREALLYVGRKNGKTPLCAAIALYVFFADDETGQQDYIAAGEREQASMLFRHAEGMVRQEPEMDSRCRIYGGGGGGSQGKSIVREQDGSFLRVISAQADTKHGGNTHLAIIDELHVQPNRDLVDVLKTSMASANRKQPLLIYLTTADHDRPSICNEVHKYACSVRDGTIDDPTFLPAVYEPAEQDEWTLEATWRKANPNLGVSVSLSYLQGECRKAQANPAYENTFKRLHVNMKTGQAVRVIPLEKWDACARLPYDLDAFHGQPCYAGLDLASTTDLASLALIFPQPDDFYTVVVKFWAPRARARERSRADRVPYETWAAQGWIKLTDGDVIDYDVIRRDINDLRGTYHLMNIGADPWNATQLMTQLTADGLEVFKFIQGFASFTAPMKKMLDLITAVKLAVGNNPVLRWQASNLAALYDPAENIKPTKKDSGDRIDGQVALIMGLGRAMLEPPCVSPLVEVW